MTEQRASVVAPQHVYQPFGTCVDLMKCRDPQIVFSGPAGTGKSRACLEKLHLMCMVNPGMRGLMLRKTLASLTSTGVVTYREHVAKEHIESGEVKFFGGSSQEPAAFKYKNGSTIVLGGMDNSMKIMSSEYDVAYVQEATEITEDDWGKITTRLRNGKVSFQQLIADANPNAPQHWLKVRCDNGLTTMINSRHEDNPRLYTQVPVLDESGNVVNFVSGMLTPEGKAYVEGVLDKLIGVDYQRLRLGKWVAAEGLVYDTYNPVFNTHKAIKQPPKHWSVYLAIDFGFTNPFVCQFWAEDDDGRLYLYREIYRQGRTVAEHCQTIRAELKKQGRPRVRAVIADHDAEDRATFTKEMGLGTLPAKKTKSDGMQAVMRRLQDAGDGKPRLYLCNDATIERDEALAQLAKPTSTQQEILGYIWDRRDGRPPKEEPVKANDHGMDAMRYMVAYKDIKKKTKMRVIS